MKRKFLTARGGIAALLVILLSLCLALGLWLTSPRTVYAEENVGGQVEEPEEDESDDDTSETPGVVQIQNKWVKEPSIVSWTYGSYGSVVNPISAEAQHGDVIFSVLNTDGGVIYDSLVGFQLEKGYLPQAVSEKLATLGASRYLLRAVVNKTEQYTGLTKDVEFSVKAINRWLVAPAVLSWKYGEYDPAINFIQAVPEYGEVMIYITDLGQNVLTFNLDGNGNVPEEASDKLSVLPAGEYYMLARVNGTDDYTSLNESIANVERDGVRFSILKINNSWRTTPNIIQWSWGNYDRTKNLIMAVPSYPQNPSDTEVRFGVYTDPSCYDSYVVEGLKDFTVTAGIVDSGVARVFARLDAGTYYLFATTAGTSSYTALSSIVQFSVQSIQNNWATTPNIVQWKYGEYNRESNLITALPAHGEMEDVVFGIYSDKDCNNILSEQFSYTKLKEPVYNEDGTLEIAVSYVLDEKVYTLLEGLSAGTYYIKAEAPADANGNYSKLSSVVSFTVQSVQNHWSVTPSVIAWKYGEYDKSVNLIQAAPALGAAAVITVYHTDGEPVIYNNNGEIVSSFSLLNDDGALTVPEYVESVLKTLSVGTYYMLASVPADENGNFSGLNNYTSVEDIKAHAIEFNVTAAQNGWIEIPKILSWSEGHYDSETNKIFGTATNGNDKMIIYIYDSLGRIVTTNAGGNELDYDKIASLNVGSYKVTFEINGTDNYTGLKGETTFAVFEDSVGLGGIIATVIVFAVLDVFAAAGCIILMIFRRKKIEDAYRTMIRKELHRR